MCGCAGVDACAEGVDREPPLSDARISKICVSVSLASASCQLSIFTLASPVDQVIW